MKHWKTWLEHAFGAVGFQIVIGLVTNQWWAAGAAGVCFFLGRECAQFEDFGRSKLIKCEDGTTRRCHWDTLGSLPIGYGLQVWKWSFDSIMDVVAPIAACTLVAWWWS